jgi:hypothetical protein
VNPAKVSRANLEKFTDLPNIGPAMASDFELLGYSRCEELKGKKAWILYESLCQATGTFQDPCVLDTFMSVEAFLKGEPPRSWWEFTPLRKAKHSKDLANLATSFRK